MFLGLVLIDFFFPLPPPQRVVFLDWWCSWGVNSQKKDMRVVCVSGVLCGSGVVQEGKRKGEEHLMGREVEE